MTKLDYFRRIGIVLLFLGAFYTTVISITNVTLADMTQLVESNSLTSDSDLGDSSKTREVALEEKKLNNLTVDQQYISSEQIDGPKTLEETINVEQFPSETVLATGYTAGLESTGKTPDHPEYGITYSGVEVKRDLYSTIAADLDVYPIGTVLYIPDYGYGVVADKGSAIKGNKLDLYYPTVEEVYAEWGKKEVEVFVIELGEGELSEDQLEALNENDALQVFRDQFRSKQ